MIGKEVVVIIDRPMGTFHPVHKDLFYPINYGYIAGMIAQDGEEQDAYVIGIEKPIHSVKGVVIAIIHRNDDIEEKFVVAPKYHIYKKEEIMKLVSFQEQYFDSYVIM